MTKKQNFSLILTIVDAGFSENVIEASKKAGASGATIISGRGTSQNEDNSFMGVSIQPEKDIVMILVKKTIRKKVMKAIAQDCELEKQGKGLLVCLPVDDTVGVGHLIEK